MSWWTEFKQRRQRGRKQNEAARRAEETNKRVRRVQREQAEQRRRIETELAICRDVDNAYDEREGCPIILKRGEQVIGVGHGSGLVEVKAGRVRYEGGSRGVSFRVARGVTYRVGAHKGTAVRDPEMPRLLCSGGTVVTTNRRLVYVGPKYTREFAWDKLVSMVETRGQGGNCLLLAVSNRQKVSGVLVGDRYDDMFGRCEIGVAIFQDTLPELISELEAELVELDGPAGLAQAAEPAEPEAQQ